jgi:hypothetical protein
MAANATAAGGAAAGPAVEPEPPPQPAPPFGLTGRYLVVLEEMERPAAIQALREIAGPRVALAQEMDLGEGGLPAAAGLDGADAVLIEELGIAVVAGMDTPRLHATAARSPSVVSMEPERIVHAIQGGGGPAATLDPTAFLAGFRAGVNALADALGVPQAGAAGLVGPAFAPGAGAAAAFQDDAQFTWGLHAVGVPRAALTGRGVRVAVLDTGIDAGHPDLAGALRELRSFVRGEDGADRHGHGTHCAGTVAGAAASVRGRRYGVAPEVELFAGQVLGGPGGTGTDAGILNGIAWAVANRCDIVSMSLGAPVTPQATHSEAFERAARRALARGCLIVAAAGNESSRPARIAPVSHPANCPSIMAVAAVGSALQVADFSCGGVGQGAVDVAAPGVAVYSAYPRDQLFRRLSGTSMATPHVAGIAALMAQAQSGLRGQALWDALLARARRLPLPARDAGAGLAQVP